MRAGFFLPQLGPPTTPETNVMVARRAGAARPSSPAYLFAA